jgi:hypothetical protein
MGGWEGGVCKSLGPITRYRRQPTMAHSTGIVLNPFGVPLGCVYVRQDVSPRTRYFGSEFISCDDTKPSTDLVPDLMFQSNLFHLLRTVCCDLG